MEINTISTNEALLDKLIGLSEDTIILYFGAPNSKSNEEWVYNLDKKLFFGILQSKVYLFFHRGLVREYYIGF